MTGYDPRTKGHQGGGHRIASSTWTASLQTVKLAWSGVVFCLSNIKSKLYISMGQQQLKTAVGPFQLCGECVAKKSG